MLKMWFEKLFRSNCQPSSLCHEQQCNFVSPSDIFKYGAVFLLLLFGGFFIISMFFPEIVPPPNLQLLHDMIEVLLFALNGVNFPTGN